MPGVSAPRRIWYLITDEAYLAVTVFRFNQWLITRRSLPVRALAGPLAHLLRTWARQLTKVDLPPTARIAEGLFIGHASSIFIHEAAVIGRCCSVNHEVTIGVGGLGDRRGVPVLGDCVFVSAGAKVFGNIEIGDHVLIRPNAVLSRSVPSCSAVGGNPAVITGPARPEDVERVLFGESHVYKPGAAIPTA
ncbi:MAG TPA: hypothetical protein VGM37_04420 [Armatimonadota bacterium]|jgi:serine O-acetyltransferase